MTATEDASYDKGVCGLDDWNLCGSRDLLLCLPHIGGDFARLSRLATASSSSSISGDESLNKSSTVGASAPFGK